MRFKDLKITIVLSKQEWLNLIEYLYSGKAEITSIISSALVGMDEAKDGNIPVRCIIKASLAKDVSNRMRKIWKHERNYPPEATRFLVQQQWWLPYYCYNGMQMGIDY